MSTRAAFSAIFQLLQLPAGRRAFALSRMAEAAEALGDAALSARARDAARLDREQLALEHAWRLQRAGLTGGADPELTALDRQIDAALADLHDLIEVHARGRLPERAAAARVLLTRAFEVSVGQHSQLPWTEQSERTELLLEVLASGEPAEAVDKLGLRPLVDELRALQAAFAARLGARPAPALAWERVVEGRAAGHARYLRAVAAAIAGQDDPDALHRLLAPALQQEAELRAWRRGRRNEPAPDVDPDSGAETGAEAG
jgi:hypothetical protein